jgi:hypothetical protein
MPGPIPYIPYNPNAGLRGPGYPDGTTAVAYPGIPMGMPLGTMGGIMMSGQTSQTPHGAPSPPAEPSVTPSIADGAVRKLVSVELKSVGFEKGEPTAVRRLEYEVQACEWNDLSSQEIGILLFNVLTPSSSRAAAIPTRT